MKKNDWRWFAYGFFGTLFVWAAMNRQGFLYFTIALAVFGAVAFYISGGPWPTKHNWLMTACGVLVITFCWALWGVYSMAALGMLATTALALLALVWPTRPSWLPQKSVS